jgi:8-oxo-dGTP diphosphatase
LMISIVHVLRSAERLAARAGDDAAAVHWFEFDALPPLAFDHGLVLADALSYAAHGRRT